MRLRAFIGIAALLTTALPGLGQVPIALLYNQTDAIPGQGGALFDYFLPPSLSGGKVAFTGGNSGISPFTFGTGAYTNAYGALSTVVDINTPVPNYPGEAFGAFVSPILRGTTVGFIADDTRASGTGSGAYTFNGTAISTVAQTGDAMPGLSDTFSCICNSAITLSGQTAFAAEGASGSTAVYRGTALGNLATIADSNTLVPGGGGSKFLDLDDVDAAGSKTVFWGLSDASVQGVYAYDGSILVPVADESTAVPGGFGTFSNFFGQVVTDGTDVAFSGADQNSDYGAYTTVGGTLSVIADKNTAVPGNATAHFVLFEDIAISDGSHAFLADDDSGACAIYTDYGGSLIRVVGQGDTLFGETVDCLYFSSYGFDGNQIAFQAEFLSGNTGIFIATVPEPATLGLLALGGLMLRRRKTQRA